MTAKMYVKRRWVSWLHHIWFRLRYRLIEDRRRVVKKTRWDSILDYWRAEAALYETTKTTTSHSVESPEKNRESKGA